MDLAQTLLRSVMRAFYDTKHVLVIDALILHSAINDSDLSHLMGTNTKELHKLCGKLKEDRFLAVHTRPETKEGQQRPINKTYYYIDYRSTIDAIKWRMYLIDKKVQGTTVKAEDRKEFRCPHCSSQWTMMEVLDSIGPEGFLCHRCRHKLTRNDESTRGGHEHSARLNLQFRFITELLPRIDQVFIPDTTFEIALAAARPVVRDAALYSQTTYVPVESSTRPAAVRGLANTGPTSIYVTVTATDGLTAEEQEATRALKEALAAQNALPQHFTHSTVTNERVVLDSNETHAMPAPLPESTAKSTSFITTPTDNISAISDDYFEKLKLQQAKEAAEELEEEEEEDEDDEDDEEEEDAGFEDVVPSSAGVASGSGAATPASSAGNEATSRPAGSLTSALKRNNSGTGSGASTGATSPVTGVQTPDGSRAAKKVRIETPAVVKEAVDSEDDVEFEDV